MKITEVKLKSLLEAYNLNTNDKKPSNLVAFCRFIKILCDMEP
ncbi:hypothetical protein SAMD00020551_4735 [Mesobacillus selenatarsenatis SF-1]|uniref:Uncharacterized protein n=1 Tax=Mesobacillus selenatarsenatis (strain DSM 18680 / JCM 14380 / FERM P-15431 / SF-1) TaxID=1321606 RepID=A0A0A8XBX0_MESS1|nr:hypothetical protein SAMD00020551_4735 [Mesobacillus selenatarsenatis SF-1]